MRPPWIALLGLASACTVVPPPLGDPTPPPFAVTVRFVSDDGSALDGVSVDCGSYDPGTTFAGGRQFTLRGGRACVASVPDHLPEPFLLGRDDATRERVVRLFARAGGRRFSVHVAGDVMMGRRYEEVESPLVRGSSRDADARAVVHEIAHVFASADVSTLNYESVAGTLPMRDAYPRKRFLLQSHPDTLSALEHMGVDVVARSNNHQRDWLEAGLRTTTQALDARALPHVGALDDGDGSPREVRVRPTSAAPTLRFFSFTTVDGDVVNDAYPTDDDPVPADLPSTEAWQYESRRFGYDRDGILLPDAPRRIGTVWAAFEALEPTLDDAAAAGFYGALAEVYPELQDWVARRGHGGGEPWDLRAVARIAEARASGELVVVHLHAGFQFQPVPGDNAREIARAAVDAGADVVVAHHPHVLQGVEWYRGKLIAYSLGNFVFDQDFLATFPSAMLRLVYDGANLLEATILPVELVGYRPRFAVDGIAARTLTGIAEASVMTATAVRGTDGLVRVHHAAERGLAATDATPGGFALSDHRLCLTPTTGTTAPVGVSCTGTRCHPPLGTLLATPATGTFARALFGHGGFEHATADDDFAQPAHFVLTGPDRAVVAADDAFEGVRYLRMRRSVEDLDPLLVRPVARVPVPRHRIHAADGSASPSDPEPTHEVRFVARVTGRGQPPCAIRSDAYWFDDTNPTEDPESTLIRSTSTSFAPADSWSEHTIPLDLSPDPAGRVPNMVMLYLRVDPTSTWDAVVDVDALEVLERREAAGIPRGMGRYDEVSDGSTAFAGLDLRRIGR